MLIVNPKATSTSRRVRDLLVRTFASDLELRIAETGHRGHAIELARQAAAERLDVVIALGGDGTVNEIINGLLGPGPAAGPDAGTPALAVLPIGSANVFARALGLPNDPIGATRMVLDALRAGRYRTIGLGMADDRYFTFTAGFGLDAEVVAAVERRRHAGAKATPALYLGTALLQFFRRTDRRRPALSVERTAGPPVERLFMAIVSNTAPWTYAGRVPVNPSPLAHFSSGLEVFGIRSLNVPSVLSIAAGMLLARTRPVQGAQVVNLHDEEEFTVCAGRPIAFQLDGEYLGLRERVTFRSVPKALRIVI